MKWNWVGKIPVFSRFFAAVEKFAGRAAAGHLILRRRTPGNFRQVAAGQLRSQVELLELWVGIHARRLPWQDERLDYQRGKAGSPSDGSSSKRCAALDLIEGGGGWTNSILPSSIIYLAVRPERRRRSCAPPSPPSRACVLPTD